MNVNFATDCIYLQLWMCGLRRCGPVSVLTGYVSANGHKTRHQSEGIVPCGDCSVAHKSELIEILEFTHFFEHFTFDKTDYSERGKHMKKYIRVVVAVELVTVGAKIEPTS